MKIVLQRLLVPFLFTTLYLGSSSGAKAQLKDTTTYDYNQYGGGCYICGGNYTCFTYDQQSLVDNSGGRRIKQLLIKVYHTTCGYGNFYAVMNGDTIGSFTRSYSCSCSDCYMDTMLVDASALKNYIYNGTNYIAFQGMQLCVDRIVVIRTYSATSYNDAGVMSVDSPFFACPGTRNIKATIANLGRNRMDSVEVHWTLNGVTKTTLKYRSLLDTIGGSGSNSAKVTLGTVTLTPNKLDTIKVWTAMPNGIADTSNRNDTLRALVSPSYGDTITVGGSNPNFATIQGAINALQSRGLCKSVIVNIRPGTYNEQLTIGKIPGTDSLHSVTFRSSTGNSSDVNIYYSSTSSTNNYTLLLNNAQDIRFSQVTIEADGSSYGHVIEIRGTFLRQAFLNCKLVGITTTSTSTNMALVTHGTINNGVNRNLTFDYCDIIDGSIGFYWGTSTAANTLNITNSKFSGQYYTNLFIYYINKVIVHNNDISRASGSYPSAYGIYVYNNQNVRITNNRIVLPCGGYGISTQYLYGSSALRNLIANNFISVGRAASVNTYAWYSYSCSFVDFYFNNTFTKTTATGYYNLQIYYGNDIRVRNNSILHDANGSLMYLYYSGTRNVEKCDNNNFYSTSSSTGFYDLANIPNLLSWQSTTKLDSFSTYGNPNYKSTSNLHVYSSDLNGRAKPDSRITTDIDGQTRNSTKPDIGADEFSLAPIDAGVSGIMPFKADSVCVQAVLKNNGNDTLRTATLGWSINGTSKTAYSWSGTLASGETAIVCVGKHKFIGTTVYTVKVWSSSPNGQADTLNFNDTFTKIGKPALSGIYTIGGTSPDFSTFNAAVSAMVAGGIIDSVLFKVRNGTYSERVEIPLIAGATRMNAIAFESENKNSSLVTLSYATSYSFYEVLYLNAARWVTFRYITIKSTTSLPSRAVTLANGASNIEFFGNALVSSSTTSTDNSYGAVVYASGNQGTNIRFINNQFTNGATGLYMYLCTGLTMTGNTFTNAYYMGLYLENITNFVFSNNTVRSNSTYSGHYSAYIYSLYGTNIISGNRIEGPNQSEYTALYIQYIYTNSSTDSSYIFNNFISSGGNNCQRTVYLYNCTNTFFVHNNIHHYGAYSSTYYAMQVYYTYSSFFYNNNFVTSGTGIPLFLAYPSTTKQDFNNFYTTGSTLATLNFSNYSSLASLKASGLDSNARKTNPNFNSNTDLHIQSVALNATGKKLHVALRDIDGEKRDSITPDIGADEFVPAVRDAGVIAFISPGGLITADTTLIKVVVRNLGLDSFFSFKVRCKINKDTFAAITVTRAIAPGDTVQVILGKYLFRRDSINNLSAWTFQPNGANDQKPSNDTFRIINKKTSMSGVYTIGGTSPDFPNFKAALNAMYNLGIAGNVRFRVRSGTYTEQLRILPIPGAGAVNSVIFESSTLDSTTVTLQYNSAYSDTNYVVFFNGCSGITFRKMTIKSLSSSYPVVVLFENRALYNTLNNNYIKGTSTSSTSSSYSVIGSFNSTYGDEFNEISNNLIEGGSMGMYWYGYGSPNYQENGNKIRNNYFKNQYYMGIYSYYQTNFQIDGNTFNSSSTYSYYYALYGNYLNNKTRITANKITNNSYGYGIYLYNSTGNSSDSVLIANNFINLGGSSTNPYGIYLDYPYYTHLVNNTIKIASTTNSSAFGIYTYSGNYNHILNNIIENAGPGYCMYIQHSSSIVRSDYNNFRTAGTNIIYWNGSNYTTLSGFQSATLKDSHTLALDPLFLSTTDLHTRQIGFNGKAKPHRLVKVDIDGEARNATTPDIGADEFSPPALDASVVEFFSPKDGIKPDTMKIIVVVRNVGTSTLTSYKVGCKINKDTFVTVNVSKTLASGDTALITIGKYRFRKDSINNLTAWTFMPNGSADQNPTNDTFRIKNKKTAMSGVYTIGGTSPDFPTFKAAIKAMNLLGIVDGVRFRVRSGAYTEQLRFGPIVGAGAPNSVIFESANLDSNSVVLQHNSVFYDSNYVVMFDGASGITFRKMKIRSLNTSYSVVFLYENGARYNMLTNNYIVGNGVGATSSYNSVIGSFNSSLTDDFNEISNNLIEGGGFGIYWYGYGSPAGQENGTKIKNNVFKDQYYMGIYIHYQTNAEIDHNVFRSSSTYSTTYPIYAQYLNNKTRITANHIDMDNANGYGLYIYNPNGNGDTVLVANNIINIGGTGSNGINLNYGYYVHLVNNTIRMGASNNNSTSGIYVYSGNYNHILNNIIENAGTGYCMDIPTPSVITKSNRNNFRSAGTYLVRWNAIDYQTIAALKAVSLKDSGSFSLDPLFVSTDNLHIRQIGLNGKASPHPLVKKDFDGQTREALKPDIGADEFNPPALDAGIFDIITPKTPYLRDSQFVAVVLKNYGLNTLNSVNINWTLQGVPQSVVSWTGSLGSNDTLHVRLVRKFFHRDSAYSTKVWTSLPNSYNDTVNYNDTSEATDQYPALSGTYTIGGASPDFNSFTDAVDAMIRGGIVGNVLFNVRNGTYSEKIAIPKIKGAIKRNDIVFQSENLDSTKVILVNGYSSYYDNYTLWLNGAVGVTFRKMTISSTNTSYGTVVYISGGASMNTFSNTILEGVSTTSTGTEMGVVISAITNNSNNSNNHFRNNVLKNGSYGIYAYGYAGGYLDKNTLISNNIIETPYYTGIYLVYNDTAIVAGNRISVGTHSGAFGIRMEYCNGAYIISGNSVIVPNGYMGMYLYGTSGYAGKTALISNNMVSVSGNGNNYGIYGYSTSYVNYYNNNVHIDANNTSSYAAMIYGSNLRSVNNIFDHTGTGYAFYNNSSSFTESNHNCYRTAGSNLAYWNGDRANLAALKAANSMDNKSISVDPTFVSGTDLHTRAIDLDKAGKLLNVVRHDFDGTRRDSILPDIGADEFQIPSPNDAGISAYIGPIPPFSPGSNVVKVTLNNYGSDTLKNVTIRWTMNGVSQTNYSWTGAIKSGASATVNVGSFSFSAGVKYSLVAWPTSPNGIPDTIYYNDTLKKTNIYSGLAGIYTVGGYLPDFKNFAEANQALMQRGVLDTVIFNVRNGTYNEQVEIVPYPGAAANRPVTFTSESGDSSKVLLQFNNTDNNFVFHVKGADYITVKRITIKSYGSYYYNHVVLIDNEAKNTVISNNRIISTPSYYYYYGYYGCGIISGSDRDDNTQILNNYITGDIGIQIYGGGSASNQQEAGLVIEGNKINDFVYMGIRGAYLNAPVIRGNELNPSGGYGNYMIYLSSIYNDMVLSHNKLTGNTATYYGIYLNDQQGTSTKRTRIFNNFISMPDPYYYGIYLYGTTYTNVYYNSVNMYGTSTNSNSSAINIGSAVNLELKNNILCNNAGTYAIYCDNVPAVSNYNDIYTNGTNLGFVNPNTYTSFAGWKAGTSRDANSKSVNPTFFTNTDLHTTLVNLDSAAIPITGFDDDIDKNARNATRPDIGADEFNSLPNNVAITRILNPVNGCMIDSQQLRVTIFNYGSYQQKNFPVRYRINGGTIFTQTFTDSILPGTSKQFNFSGKAATKLTGTYDFKVWTDLTTDQYRLNDTIKSSIINYAIPDSVKTMIPADSIKNLAYPISLSWSPSNGATLYDLYLWPDTAAQRPSSPTYYGLTQISLQINGGLNYGETYKWQLFARNPSCGTFGKVQRFTVRELPDLIVKSVSVPTTAFSGNSISVSWVIKNNGKGSTGSNAWYDLLYLSTDQILDGLDPLLTGVINATALNASQSYNTSTNVTLPNGIIGKYYILVKTEAYNYFLESNEGNNISTDTTSMAVSLTPPPDLQVTSIIPKPNPAFSGSNLNVQYTVKNKGTGSTITGMWYDYIYLHDDSSSGGVYQKTIQRNGTLDVDSSYKVSTTITLPFNLSGRYFIVVKTDVFNYVYEHAAENNNTGISNSFKVIQTPPPDLIVRNVKLKDTVSNKENVTLSYDLINQGGSVTTNTWYDNIYISKFPTFNISNATYLTQFGRSNINYDDTLKASHNINIPDNINGLFYLFVLTDYYNHQFEGVNDTNNMSVKLPFRIVSPDLVISSVTVPSADTSGKLIKVDWVVKNKGIGRHLGGSREDKIFISRHSPYHKDSVKVIDSILYVASLNPNDSILKSHFARIPNGTIGSRYIYVTTDVRNVIYENGKDTNNTRRSGSMNVFLAPYPDLRTDLVNTPDSTEAGQVVSMSYKITNKGNRYAPPTWKDRIYISKDSVYNPAKVVLLQTNNISTSLKIDSSYERSQNILMPSIISAGNYYFFVFTDATNVLYEYAFEGNNIKRSKKVYVKGYPPIDLTIVESTIPDSIYSGTTGKFTWKVKNIGDAKTIVNSWTDKVYLSLDSIADPTDQSIGDVKITMTLEKDSSYSRSISFAAPNGISGQYYVFFETDWKKENTDDDTLNNIKIARLSNGKPKKMKIILSKSADLRYTSWNVPSTAVAGQPSKISWKVQNNGDTTTKAGTWYDAVYLSTDYVLDGGDYFVGNTVHTGNILKGHSYLDTLFFYIPSYINGNYIAILRTDNTNREYEHNAENNNTGASAITITIAPPGDLVVTTVTAPGNAIAGSSVNVNYSIKNIGSNPINGTRTDNIYLSEDSIFDETDVLFASKTEYASIVPNGVRNLIATGPVTGIKTGTYYFLVYTDIRDNISESKDTNNIGYSAVMEVSVPELVLNILTQDSLFNNKNLYYRLLIPDSLAGESVLVTLKGDSIKGNNELYVSYQNVPTRSDFDYAFSIPYYGNQEVLIPSVQGGTYYIMAYGRTTLGTKQAIKLLAKKLEFEIRKVNPVKGGNTGFVTLKIEGSKFDSTTVFTLNNGPGGDIIVHPVQIPDSTLFLFNTLGQGPKSAKIVNPTLAYVTFDLRGKQLGHYDVVASKDNGEKTARLVKGFEVVPGSPPDIQVSVLSPSSTRANMLTSFDVMFHNAGNTDMTNGFLEVISNGGAPISLTIDGLKNKATSIFIPLEEFNGVKGILRPGGSGTITVYTNSIISLAFNIIIPN